jgi:FMN phosphatase YigB (HAD superfamily)
MNKVLLTDLDDTVLHWNSQFYPFLEKKGYAKRSGEYFHFNFKNLSHTKLDDLILEFQHSNFFQGLDAFECAVDVLPQFKMEGWAVIGISAARNTDIALANRHINLKESLDNIFDHVFHTDDHFGKRQYLEKYPNSIWVEDNVHNALMGARYGHKTFLMDQPHNRDCTSKLVTRVNSWDEIWDYVIDTYE